jgi:hypothetical protein
LEEAPVKSNATTQTVIPPTMIIFWPFFTQYWAGGSNLFGRVRWCLQWREPRTEHPVRFELVGQLWTWTWVRFSEVQVRTWFSNWTCPSLITIVF